MNVVLQKEKIGMSLFDLPKDNDDDGAVYDGKYVSIVVLSWRRTSLNDSHRRR